jgi:gluconolactonase
MKVYSLPLDEDGLVAGPRRVLVDYGSEQGCDGMTVDEHGNLYLASRSAARPGILVINPDGEEIAFIATGPENQGDAEDKTGIPSNVEFGIGDESNVLYLTVDVSLYRIELGVNGHQPF